MKYVIEATDSFGNAFAIQYPTAAARNKALKLKGQIAARAKLGIIGATAVDIPEMVEKVNLMSGKTYMEEIDTPIYCSPSSESYWSM